MAPQNNMYKYLSVVLAIIAVVFAVLYFTKPSDRVSETYQDISSEAGECRSRLADWQEARVASATTTEADRDELMTILDDCKDTFTDAQERI